MVKHYLQPEKETWEDIINLMRLAESQQPKIAVPLIDPAESLPDVINPLARRDFFPTEGLPRLRFTDSIFGRKL